MSGGRNLSGRFGVAELAAAGAGAAVVVLGLACWNLFPRLARREVPGDDAAWAWHGSMADRDATARRIAVVRSRPGTAARAPRVPAGARRDVPAPAAAPFGPPPDVVVDDPTDSSGARSDNGAEVAQSLADVVSEQPGMAVERFEEVVDSDIHVDAPDQVMSSSGLQIDGSPTIRGDVAVGTVGASGAVDRLTAEIRASLDQRPTLVVWVFDQSVSLAAQRKEIAARLDRVFDELGVTGSDPKRPDLTHMVFAFGNRVTPVVLKPTRESAEVVQAIESIPVDESGVEMTFTALAEAAKAATTARVSPRERNVMIIAFTDEVGNDQDAKLPDGKNLVDQVAAFCRTQAMPVYVVGVPAPFGRRQVQVRFVEFDPKYAAEDQFPVVDQGPETLFPEVVNIRSGTVFEEPMDSGFGPYSLSKVCAETGGIYFCVHANRDTSGRVSETAPMASRLRYFFDGAVMRGYRPDYLPAVKVEQLLASNRAKRALVDAARQSAIGQMKEPRMTFPREDDAKLATLLGEAQKVAAILAPKIDSLYGILVAGRADRDKLGADEKRWQAGYDLALGRVLAAKVRTDAYNVMLAQAKAGMTFKDPASDTWTLVPSDDVPPVGRQAQQFAAEARSLLERVVKEHPGTPWALIAADELKTPLGYEWRESFTGVDEPKGDRGGGDAPRRSDDGPGDLAPPKPRRPMRNL